ncbi:unnamed protein product, partial [Prorocentrum cordatum]
IVAPLFAGCVTGLGALVLAAAVALIWFEVAVRARGQESDLVCAVLLAGAAQLGDRIAVMTAQDGFAEGLMIDKAATCLWQGISRTCAVRFDQQSDRRCCFEDMDADSLEVSLVGGFPVRGLRHTLWTIKFTQDHSGAVLAAPRQWVHVTRAPPCHRSVYEHGARSRVFDAVLTIDQENDPASLSMDCARWRLALIKEEVRLCPSAPAYFYRGQLH